MSEQLTTTAIQVSLLAQGNNCSCLVILFDKDRKKKLTITNGYTNEQTEAGQEIHGPVSKAAHKQKNVSVNTYLYI